MDVFLNLDFFFTDIEHFVEYLLAIYVSLLEKSVSSSTVPFLIELLVFLP